jgi:hypothetical protein
MEITPDGIKGTIHKKLQGYFAIDAYDELMYSNDKDIKQYLKSEFTRGSNKFQLDTFRVDKQPATNEIMLTGNFTLPDYSKKLDNDYYLNLNLFKFYSGDRLDYPERKAPVERNFRSVRKYVTILKIPDNYKLTYLPQSKTYHNKVWGFDIKYEQKSNEVILTQEFDNDNLLLTSENFQAWNSVLDNLFPLYKETLSLSKN